MRERERKRVSETPRDLQVVKAHHVRARSPRRAIVVARNGCARSSAWRASARSCRRSRARSRAAEPRACEHASHFALAFFCSKRGFLLPSDSYSNTIFLCSLPHHVSSQKKIGCRKLPLISNLPLFNISEQLLSICS